MCVLSTHVFATEGAVAQLIDSHPAVPDIAPRITTSTSSARPPPGHTRALVVPRISQPPVIDGKLDDAAWRNAPVADRFWISEQQRAPSEKTEVLVTADRDHLYFAFRVFDTRP